MSYESLAVAVLRQAVRDAREGHGRTREDAVAFLCTPGPTRDHWLLMAGFTPGRRTKSGARVLRWIAGVAK